MARVPTLEELTDRIRAGEAVPVGSMKDAAGHEVTLATVDSMPVVLGAPADVSTPETRAEFTRLWGQAVKQAGIRVEALSFAELQAAGGEARDGE